MAVAIGNITTSATNLTFTQLTSVACSTCTICNQGVAAMAVGLSVTPGSNYITIPPNGGQFLFVVSNANLLWVANITGSATQVCSFLTQ